MRNSNLNNFTVKKFGTLQNPKLFDRGEDYKSLDDRTLRTELFPIVFFFFLSFSSFSIVINRPRSILREKRSNFLRVYAFYVASISRVKDVKKEKREHKKKQVKTYKLLFVRICEEKRIGEYLHWHQGRREGEKVRLTRSIQQSLQRARCLKAARYRRENEKARKAYISTRIA